MMLRTEFINEQKLPLAVFPGDEGNCPSALGGMVLRYAKFLGENLLTYGALLFRNFQITTPEEFESFVRTFSDRETMNYAGGVSPRVTLGSGVYSSTEYPADLTLSLHNELSYSTIFPRRLYFCCLTEPRNGGETTLGNSRRILENIDQRTVAVFKKKKVRYDRNLSGNPDDGYSWQKAFETGSRSDAEDTCFKMGARFNWRPDGGLTVSQVRPATAIHPETRQEVWFNQAEGFHPTALDPVTYDLIASSGERFRLESFFGDGTQISIETLENIRAAQARETIKHRWQKGDILVLDNMLTAHGRMPFEGPRKIALAMT